jgi:hypothetical protein
VNDFFQLQNTMIILLIYLGVFFRRKRKIHVKLMIFSIIWDVLLIFQIEFYRHAINKTLKAFTNPLILNIHILLAISSVIMYGVMIYTGRKLLAGDKLVRIKHKRAGYTTLVLRTLTYITSYFAVTS